MRVGLLSGIAEPGDLRKLSQAQLRQLAAEIREVMIDTVAANGGHLAPSLGVVELTLAVHTVFDSPRDKIIWDVGHQSYAHKLVTGRASRFGTLRQFGGLSGFPRRKESPHDALDTGHACTSISCALGYARARDLRGEKYSVVAVIGDGSLTGGMALEALNNAGHQGTDLIVILNDNSMAIGPNVGALPAYLSRLRSDPTYSRVKADLEQALRKIPVIGEPVRKAVERVKDSLKYLVLPGMLFEELGFTYLGPIDGHNIAALQSVLRDARQKGGPVLVHVITTKGKGYAPAEANPDIFHGTGPFDRKTGRALNKGGPPSYSEVFGATVTRLAADDGRIVAITAAMADGTGLQGFARQFPDRFFDVGIAEQHAVTFAAGLALGGMRPVVAIYSTFLQRAYDQVIHDVCLQNLPVVLALDRAGLVGEDGATHQGIFDHSFLRPIPNLVVMAPMDENELRHMLYTALQHDGPVSIRYPRGKGRGVRLENPLRRLPLGTAQVLRKGKDVAILAIGNMVHPALAAASLLEQQGIEAWVVNARFLKPLDTDLITRLASSTGRVVTVEENVVAGGFGSAVAEVLAERGITARLRCLGLPDAFVDHGVASYQMSAWGLDEKGIADAVRQLVPRDDAAAVACAGRDG